MTKTKQNKLVPVLRFPEFENDGEWKETILESVSEFVDSLHETPKQYVEVGYPMVRVTDVNKNSLNVNNCLKVTKDVYNHFTKRYKPKKGNLIFSRVGSCGDTVLIDFNEEVCLGQNTVLIKAKENSSFLFFYLKSNLIQEQVKRNIVGSSHKTLSLKNIRAFDVYIPKPKEQQKIANCLSSLDNVITAETEKLDHLKAHKKGLLQNLFPTNSITNSQSSITSGTNRNSKFVIRNSNVIRNSRVPQVRFPEFEKNEGWITKPLKKVFSIFQGYAFSSRDSAENGTRWLKIADVSIQKMNPNNPSFLPAEYIGTYDKFLMKKGDYVLALTRPILNGKLKISAVDDLFHNSLLNQRVGKLISNENLALVYYLLQTHYLIGEIEKSIAGSEPPNLSMKQIENIPISIPKDPKEQQKIADCLSSLDDLIQSQTEKTEALKEHKKGLMQQLFPNINDV